MADKVKPLDTETWLLIPAIEVLGDPFGIGVAGTAPIGALSAALVNEYIDIQTRASTGYTGAGGNITRATKDSSKADFTASATDKDKAINDYGNVTIPTSQNYTCSVDLFRDKDLAATDSNYNVANDAVRAPGIRYLLVRRIGPAWNTTAVAGQKYNAFYIDTDNPIDVYGDGNNQYVTSAFIGKSIGVEDAVLV